MFGAHIAWLIVVSSGILTSMVLGQRKLQALRDVLFSSSSPGRGLVSGVGDDEACTDHRSWTRQKRARWGLVEKTLCVL